MLALQGVARTSAGFFIDKHPIKNYTVTLHTTLIMMMIPRLFETSHREEVT